MQWKNSKVTSILWIFNWIFFVFLSAMRYGEKGAAARVTWIRWFVARNCSPECQAFQSDTYLQVQSGECYVWHGSRWTSQNDSELSRLEPPLLGESKTAASLQPYTMIIPTPVELWERFLSFWIGGSWVIICSCSGVHSGPAAERRSQEVDCLCLWSTVCSSWCLVLQWTLDYL